jgi:hypothetical protein
MICKLALILQADKDNGQFFATMLAAAKGIPKTLMKSSPTAREAIKMFVGVLRSLLLTMTKIRSVLQVIARMEIMTALTARNTSILPSFLIGGLLVLLSDIAFSLVNCLNYD